MEDKIGNLKDNGLIAENYAGDFPRQMPIYLLVDWQTGEITAQVRNYHIGGVPARQWNGYEHAIHLSANIDAERLAADIFEHYAEKLDAVRSGWSEYYDGNNNKGTLTDMAQELLMVIDQDIEYGVYLSEIDEERFTGYLIDKGIIDEDGNE
jgi:hypothetical protein